MLKITKLPKFTICGCATSYATDSIPLLRSYSKIDVPKSKINNRDFCHSGIQLLLNIALQFSLPCYLNKHQMRNKNLICSENYVCLREREAAKPSPS